MSTEKFRDEFAELLGLEPARLVDSLTLASGNWDSLALLSTTALLDEHFGIVTEGRTIGRLVTYGDLKALIAAKAER